MSNILKMFVYGAAFAIIFNGVNSATIAETSTATDTTSSTAPNLENLSDILITTSTSTPSTERYPKLFDENDNFGKMKILNNLKYQLIETPI